MFCFIIARDFDLLPFAFLIFRLLYLASVPGGRGMENGKRALFTYPSSFLYHVIHHFYHIPSKAFFLFFTSSVTYPPQHPVYPSIPYFFGLENFVYRYRFFLGSLLMVYEKW